VLSKHTKKDAKQVWIQQGNQSFLKIPVLPCRVAINGDSLPAPLELMRKKKKRNFWFYPFWIGIVVLFLSIWIKRYSQELFNTAWLLIILSIVFAIPKAFKDPEKDRKN